MKKIDYKYTYMAQKKQTTKTLEESRKIGGSKDLKILINYISLINSEIGLVNAESHICSAQLSLFIFSYNLKNPLANGML